MRYWLRWGGIVLFAFAIADLIQTQAELVVEIPYNVKEISSKMLEKKSQTELKLREHLPVVLQGGYVDKPLFHWTRTAYQAPPKPNIARASAEKVSEKQLKKRSADSGGGREGKNKERVEKKPVKKVIPFPSIELVGVINRGPFHAVIVYDLTKKEQYVLNKGSTIGAWTLKQIEPQFAMFMTADGRVEKLFFYP